MKTNRVTELRKNCFLRENENRQSIMHSRNGYVKLTSHEQKSMCVGCVNTSTLINSMFTNDDIVTTTVSDSSVMFKPNLWFSFLFGGIGGEDLRKRKRGQV